MLPCRSLKRRSCGESRRITKHDYSSDDDNYERCHRSSLDYDHYHDGYHYHRDRHYVALPVIISLALSLQLPYNQDHDHDHYYYTTTATTNPTATTTTTTTSTGPPPPFLLQQRTDGDDKRGLTHCKLFLRPLRLEAEPVVREGLGPSSHDLSIPSDRLIHVSDVNCSLDIYFGQYG